MLPIPPSLLMEEHWCRMVSHTAHVLAMQLLTPATLTSHNPRSHAQWSVSDPQHLLSPHLAARQRCKEVMLAEPREADLQTTTACWSVCLFATHLMRKPTEKPTGTCSSILAQVAAFQHFSMMTRNRHGLLAPDCVMCHLLLQLRGWGGIGEE